MTEPLFPQQRTDQPRVEFDFAGLVGQKPVLWTSGLTPTAPLAGAASALSAAGIEAARSRLARFEPLLAMLCDGLQETAGKIESPLQAVPELQLALDIPLACGSLFIKADHQLPMAGSVKARGGTHEVIEFAERLALEHGLITPESDYRSLASAEARALFSRHTIAVGSTGNLGLAIGTMASALGFRAEVHMSADAKEWKKERLRTRGVQVIEHEGDYASAVAAGRAAAEADPFCHFVDDERSTSLFLGYATAAAHLAEQLAEAGRRVDATHPLFVYLPCGVGGAPGGIAYGLEQVFGPHVHCLFAEPTASPCFLVQMLAGSAWLADAGPNPSVYDIGLDNRTEADGLAVPRASELAAAAVGALIAGVYTVEDATLFRHLYMARATQGIQIEPSAAAGLSGPGMLLNTPQGRDYLQRRNLLPLLQDATHIAWLTGGSLVPATEYERFLRQGEACQQQTPSL
ncbi:D-serine dehydratase [compost metagenome]